MYIFEQIYLIIFYAVTTVIVATIVLTLLRLIVNHADINPFTWFAINIRRLSDPLINPVRRQLVNMGVDPKYAPLITILLVILVGWFAVQLASSVCNTLAGIVFALQSRAPVALIGYTLFGLLGIYSLLIFIRIIFSWGMVSHRNVAMYFLVKTTDPLLVPLRRIIPTVGMIDISPIVAFILIWLFQGAVAGTLLAQYPKQFF